MAQKFDLLIKAKTTGQAGIKKMGNSMQGLQGRLKNVRAAALSAGTAFKALALIVSAGAFTKFVKSSIDQADAFGKLSTQTGIAANTLQSYVNAGKLAGVEQSTIDKGLRRLAQSMREADQGVATYADAYRALGVTVRDSDGNLKESEVVLAELADRFKDMPNGATKAALAMEIFGRSGASLIPMLNEGSEAMNKFNYETSEGFAQNAEYFNDQLTVLGIGFDGFRQQLTDALLPALNSILEVFSDVLGSQNDWSGFFKFVEGAIRGIAITVFGVAKLFQEIGKLGETIINRVKQMMETIDRSTPKWVKNLMSGGAKNLKTLGSRFIAQQKTNARNLLGDDYVDAAKTRFQSNIPQLTQLATGKSNAPDKYFREGTREAKVLGSQISETTGKFHGLKRASDETEESLGNTFGSVMQRKLDDFRGSIKSVEVSMADVVVKGIKGMEDALVDFVMTGKLNFRDLANSMIRDMIRIQIQQSITRPLSNWIGGLFSEKGNVLQNGKHLTEFSKGGVIDSPHFKYMANGGIAVAGEAGPEAILPLTRRNGVLGVQGGGNNTVVNVAVDASGSSVEGDEQGGRMLGQLIGVAVKSELIKQYRPGGLLNPA